MNSGPVTVHSTLRVVYVSQVRLNPYVPLLADGVKKADPRIKTSIRRSLDWRWLLDPRLDIIHLHWAELQYSYGHRSKSDAEKGAQDLLRKLGFARKRGCHLVYTVHNISQHEGRFSALNEQVNQWLFAHADAIHVHGTSSADSVAQIYGRRQNVFVIPHGNYIGVYPNTVSREHARNHLGIPSDHFVYLCLGQVRPYKGLDTLIDAFNKMALPETTLVVAGMIELPEYAEQVRVQANGNPNIKLIPNYIQNADLQYYFNAADVCVLPYRQATTSGAALLAYSFGKPLVAPALGPFPDLITPERGLLFEPGEHGLQEALTQARHLDAVQSGKAISNFAAAHDWTTLGAQHASVYRALLSSSN